MRLVKTCSACPEQWDVLDAGQRVVGYLRLRYGLFTAEAVKGQDWYRDGSPITLVYSHEWPDDDYKGQFDSASEAEVHLAAAVAALEAHYSVGFPVQQENAMKYRSRPVEVEAMRWQGPDAEGIANYIVAWVNANGGEARYEPGGEYGGFATVQPRIAVRTINGWAYAAPGHYIVMGDATFHPASYDSNMPDCRDFYPVDPETFDRRWGPS